MNAYIKHNFITLFYKIVFRYMDNKFEKVKEQRLSRGMKVSDIINSLFSAGSSGSCFDGNRLGSWYSCSNNVDDSFRAKRRLVLKTRIKYHTLDIT